MDSNETTTMALVWLGLVVFLAKGWLNNAKAWVVGRTHPDSSGGNTSANAAPAQPGKLGMAAPLAHPDAATAAQAVRAAGFNGMGLVTALAVARAESGYLPTARNVNNDGSIDRGLFQINSRWHPEVSDDCAYNPLCAAKAAYRISGQGANWHAWSSFTSGAYAKFMTEARGLAMQLPSLPVVNAPAPLGKS